jgi:hypothetical protein
VKYGEGLQGTLLAIATMGYSDLATIEKRSRRTRIQQRKLRRQEVGRKAKSCEVS